MTSEEEKLLFTTYGYSSEKEFKENKNKRFKILEAFLKENFTSKNPEINWATPCVLKIENMKADLIYDHVTLSYNEKTTKVMDELDSQLFIEVSYTFYFGRRKETLIGMLNILNSLVASRMG